MGDRVDPFPPTKIGEPVVLPRLTLNGPAVAAALEQAATNTLEASAIEKGDHTGEAELAVNRTWTNGWALTTYAKAWWNGHEVVDVGGGVKVRKTF